MRNRRRQQPRKSKLAAAFIALVFGWGGAHHFYLNRGGAGLTYIFLLVAGINLFGMPITAVLGFMEAFRFLTMSEEDFDKRYNKHVAPKTQRRGREREQTVRRRQEPVINVKRKKLNPFKKSGVEKYKEFALEEAIEDFKKGLDIDNEDITLHFNIACAYSLTEQKEKAYYHLSKAVQFGFNDFEKIQKHDDLAYVRIQPEFDSFKKSGFRLDRNMMPKNDDGTPIEVEDDALLSQLNKLAEMRKRGLLSEDDFVLERKKLLRS